MKFLNNDLLVKFQYDIIMRYTHSFKAIRKQRHAGKISLIISGLILGLVILLGFSALDAKLFFGGFLQSLTRVIISYGISLVIALLIALFTLSSKKIEDLLIPILDVLQSFPSFALYPLFVVWFGKTSLVTILILIINMVWPILFTVLTAQKQLRGDIVEAATIFGAKGFKYLIFVFMPLIFPAIITGSLIAWGEAWEAIIATEIIVQVPGVGSYLAQTGDHNPQILLIGIALLLMLLFLLNKYIWVPLLNLSTRYQNE